MQKKGAANRSLFYVQFLGSGYFLSIFMHWHEPWHGHPRTFFSSPISLPG